MNKIIFLIVAVISIAINTNAQRFKLKNDSSYYYIGTDNTGDYYLHEPNQKYYYDEKGSCELTFVIVYNENTIIKEKVANDLDIDPTMGIIDVMYYKGQKAMLITHKSLCNPDELRVLLSNEDIKEITENKILRRGSYIIGL